MSGCADEQGLISVNDALAAIRHNVQALAVEQIHLSDGLNRYLAQDVYAHIDLPPFAQSAVDGYALCIHPRMPEQRYFKVMDELRAGQSSNIMLTQGQAVRIFTGAPIPTGTTTVARQEVVNVVENDGIELKQTLPVHTDIRNQGEEVSRGQLLAQRGQKLSVGVIASLSMAGIFQVIVTRYPKVAVVVTGDEVAQNLTDFEQGKIFDANAPLIAAWFQQQGQCPEIFHVADNIKQLKSLLASLVDRFDLILTTGGVSVGDYDFIRPVALALDFDQIFWKVKQKPGKPLFFAQYHRVDQSYCYLLGLPGNPAAVYVGMQVYAATLIHALQNQNKALPWISGILSQAIASDARERFLRMCVDVQDGLLQLRQLPKQQSHMLSNLMQAQCLVRIPAGQNCGIGQAVDLLLID